MKCPLNPRLVEPPPPPVDTAARAARNAALDAAQATMLRYRAAARLAEKLYPPPIARLVKDDLNAWCDWGHRVAVAGPTQVLCEQVEADAAERGVA